MRGGGHIEKEALREFCEYIQQHVTTISVFRDGKLCRLSDLSAVEAIHEVMGFLSVGHVPLDDVSEH